MWYPCPLGRLLAGGAPLVSACAAAISCPCSQLTCPAPMMSHELCYRVYVGAQIQGIRVHFTLSVFYIWVLVGVCKLPRD